MTTTTTASDTILAGRFEVQRTLGSGSFGTTYACIDKSTGKEVAVKELKISRVDDWKAIELFEREAKTLQRLDHGAIPDYVDFIPSKAQESAYLAQELAPGSTLEELLAARGRFNQSQAREVATQLLDVLKYLDSCRPPVVHRDIKPANILGDSADRFYLVDFGSVANLVGSSSRGSTVAGTFGYMAPEQLHGQATVASDIYSLGMTLIHLVTGRAPEELPRSRMAVQFREFAPQIDDHFAALIEKMTAPATEDRFYNAREALDFLERRPSASSPSESAIEVSGSLTSSVQTVQSVQTPRKADLLGVFRLVLVFAFTILIFDIIVHFLPAFLDNYILGGISALLFGPLGAIFSVALLVKYLFRNGARGGEEFRTSRATGVVIRSGSKESDAWVDFSFSARGWDYTMRDDLKDYYLVWSEDLAREAAASFPPGMKVSVRYDPDNPQNARFRPSISSPREIFFADLKWGSVFAAFGFGLSCWYSYYLNSAYYPVGDGGTNIRREAQFESLFHLPLLINLFLASLALLLLVNTYFYDLVRERIPKPIPQIFVLLLLGAVIGGTGLYNPGSFFSVENRLHPAHFDRVQAKLPTLQEHQCLVATLQKREITARFGHPVEVKGPFVASTWEISKGRTPLSRRVNLEYRGYLEGPDATGEFKTRIDYRIAPVNSKLFIETYIDGQGLEVEFDGTYPCEVEQ